VSALQLRDICLFSRVIKYLFIQIPYVYIPIIFFGENGQNNDFYQTKQRIVKHKNEGQKYEY